MAIEQNVARHFVWSRHHGGSVRWSQASGTALDARDAEQLAQLLAAHAVVHRLDGAPQLLEAWIRVRTGGGAYSRLEQETLRAYLGPFDPDANADHRQGTVAEYLWHVLNIQDDNEPELVRITSPKAFVTGPGGDGLTVRRDGELYFTLWEIKKHVGAHLSTVVNGAYGQLTAKGARYLTEAASIGQLSTDPEEARKFATIVEAWLAGEGHMRAGVAVTTTSERRRCFSTMRTHFAHLHGADPCSGLLSVLTDFPSFADRVAEVAWTGL